MAGLYIHIPFCHSKCSYCDFYSTPDRRRIDDFVSALLREYNARRHEISEPFKTIYFGGGTPSILPTSTLAHLCDKLPTDDIEEFTIEVNPEDITPEIINAWRQIGINRVSMGVQSFSDTELKAINRRHSAADAANAIELLLDGGISNITCDLIYGLPGQDLASWKSSVERLLSFGLPHISAYCLSYEPGTALHARMSAGKIRPTPDETLEDMYSLLCQMTASAGYEHYEISNFAKAGKRSKHNSSYWKSTPYLGLGPGAHSFDGINRRFNPPSLKRYIDEGIITETEEENDTDRFNDMLITSLRTADGLDLTRLSDDKVKTLMAQSQVYIKSDMMHLHGNILRINEHAWFTSDSILRELIVI